MSQKFTIKRLETPKFVPNYTGNCYFNPSTPIMSESTQPENPSAETTQNPNPQTVEPLVSQDDSQAETEPDDLTKALSEVAILQAKVVELQDQFLRGQAEVLNARKRADEEVSKARKFALESFAESLLPVIDSLEAGLAFKDATQEQVIEGAQATLRQLKSALERNKVMAIEPTAGTKFDPHQHQAISMVAAEQEPNTVVSVLQKGYSIAERILRPALVTVAQSN